MNNIGQNEQSWYCDARRCPSPNFNERPDADDISLLVIHNISLPAGEFATGHPEALFLNCLDFWAHPDFYDLRGLEVSAHLLIERDGSVIQFVPFGLRAWHAGESDFCGRANCNDFSIGIELEGADDVPYEDIQYERLASITRTLMQEYPAITPDRIVGHSDIAPGRKTDPGPAFDWPRFRRMIDADNTV